MSLNVHVCNLPPKNESGFPKLPPNASWLRKLAISLRKLQAMNPNNFKCKELFPNKSFQIAEQKRYAQSPYFFVIHPFSNLSSFLQLTFCFVWVYSILADPLVSFSSSRYPTLDTFIVLAVQRLLVILYFIIGYVDKKTKEVIIKPKLIIRHYLMTYFVIDATATGVLVDIFRLIYFNQMTEDETNIFHGVSNVIRMCCYSFRIDTVLQYLQDATKHLKLSKGIQTISVHILKTVIFIHIFSCFLYGIPNKLYREHWPKESWLYQAQIHYQSNASFTKKYLECLLMSVCYFFGASHTMYEISEPNEQLCLSVITLFGRLYTLFIIADLLRIFGIAEVSGSKYEQQKNQLEEYMASRNIPDSLRTRLLKFYEYKLQKRYFNEPEILSTLSEHLRTELFLFSARKMIQKVEVLKSLPKEILSTIIASMKLQTYSPNEIIVKIGTPLENIFFISSGTVSVSNKDHMELLHLEDGDIFGITSRSRTTHGYQCQAIETTEVFYINNLIFLQLLGLYPNAVSRFRKSIDQRMSLIKMIEETIKKGGCDFLSELRSGQILESFQKRPTIEK